MIFICSIIFKYAALTDTEAIQQKMSIEQRGDFVVSQVTAPRSHHLAVPPLRPCLLL